MNLPCEISQKPDVPPADNRLETGDWRLVTGDW